MNWKDFSILIPTNNVSELVHVTGKLSNANAKIKINRINHGANAWYPIKLKDGDTKMGYRLIDQAHAYTGTTPVWLAEGSNCVIVLLIETTSQRKYAAHVDAEGHQDRIAPPLQTFKNNTTLENVELYLFTEEPYYKADGEYEVKEVAKLLSSAYTDDELTILANNTYIFSGENGKRWNSYCSVRDSYSLNAHVINVWFAA